jgi:CDGSH-type Zn-finger protein
MFSQALSRVLIASALLGTSISTSFAQNNDSDFIKIRNSYPFWNGSLKRDIQGFKPGMTESEAKQRLSDCEVSGHKVFCPGSSKDEGFELSLTEHTRPRMVKDVTYVFPAGGATLETMAKNVVMQFGVGNSQQCVPSPRGIRECSQWQLEEGSYMRLGVDVNRSKMILYLSTPKWIASLEEQAFENEQGRIPPRQF